jgi:hypothetical protein
MGQSKKKVEDCVTSRVQGRTVHRTRRRRPPQSRTKKKLSYMNYFTSRMHIVYHESTPRPSPLLLPTSLAHLPVLISSPSSPSIAEPALHCALLHDNCFRAHKSILLGLAVSDYLVDEMAARHILYSLVFAHRTGAELMRLGGCEKCVWW